MSVYIDGRYYYSPCEKCNEDRCYSCTLSKYKDDLQKERDKRISAEFRIEKELETRLKQECAAYDRWVATDRAYEWCEAFEYQVDVLVEMFEEDFDWSQFDFDGDDLASKVAKLILQHKKAEF